VNLTEFAPSSDRCTATFTSPQLTGESFGGPVSIGIYGSSPNEFWIEFEGVRVNIQADDVEAFVKQLRRAAKLSRAEP